MSRIKNCHTILVECNLLETVYSAEQHLTQNAITEVSSEVSGDEALVKGD